MNISYAWLRDLLPELSLAPAEVADRLASLGAPVEAVVDLAEPFRGLVVARVADVRPHPDADKLSLCVVDAGDEAPLSVVCGAPDVRPGGSYAFAPVGSALPGGVQIEARQIRGRMSQGMLCSERELGLGRDHSGLLRVDPGHAPGTPLSSALGLEDTLLVVEVTANRPDLLSHLGVARELSPRGVAGIRLPEFVGAEVTGGAEEVRIRELGSAGSVGDVAVSVWDSDGCPRYSAAVLKDVRIAPSPPWLSARLRAIGLRPVNNVVDATNYVLHELGQPLHAFDLARLAGPAIEVRESFAGERLVTLDGLERALPPRTVVIADAERAVAIGGIMGGENSEVGPKTQDILLECALFDPVRIRAARRVLGLSTEASYRFERGVDPQGMERALRRAVELIRAVAGGRADHDAGAVGSPPPAAAEVRLRPSRVRQVLGVEITSGEAAELLAPIGFDVRRLTDHELTVAVPGHRSYDVSREIDLVEEVARRRGFASFPDEARPFRPSTVPDDPLSLLQNRLKHLLVERGMLEARTAAFASAREGEVELLNPLSKAESRLRSSLLPGLLHRLEYNQARGVRDVRIFESGTAFAARANGGRPGESLRLAGVLTGARQPPHWSEPARNVDIWDLKGLLLDLAAALGFPSDAVRPLGSASKDGAIQSGPAHLLSPENGYAVAHGTGAAIGAGGLIRAELVDVPAWAAPIFGFELELLAELAGSREIRIEPLPAFPPIDRDLALLVPDALPAASVAASIRAAAGGLLERVELFDLFRGTGVPPGTRSLGHNLRFRAPDRTLTDVEVDRIVEKVLRTLKEELGVERR